MVTSPSEQKPLAALIRRIALADSDALRELFERTSPKVFGVILRIVRDRSCAEDVLQNVYIRIWRRAIIYDEDKGSAMAWIATIARNIAIDESRRMGNAAVRRLIELPERLADEGPLADIVLERSEEWRRLEACLAQLESKTEWAIRIAYLEGATYQTLADIEGVPLGTIKARVRRGLIRLRYLLQVNAPSGHIPSARS